MKGDTNNQNKFFVINSLHHHDFSKNNVFLFFWLSFDFVTTCKKLSTILDKI